MFTFAWPWMAALLFLPLIVRFILPPVANSATEDIPGLLFPYLQRLKASFSAALGGPVPNRFRLALLVLAWCGLTVALMQPQLVDRYTQVQNEGHDLMLAVDLSGSMEALDYSVDGHPTSRHKIIQHVVSDFVAHRQGDRLGLILFGSNAYLQVPLTYDIASVRKLLNNTQVGEAGDATAIGDAIGLAVRNLRDRPEKSRAIVLLTDGGDNASTVPPLEAARLAKQYGIPIFTIGVGSHGPVPIPDPRTGRIVMARMDLDEDLLKQISSITDGVYFRAADTDALEKAYQTIDRLEKTKSEAQSYAIRTPLYRYPLGLMLAALLLLGLMPLGQRLRHGF